MKNRAKSKYVVSWVRKVPITSIFSDECVATMLAHISCIWYPYAVTRIWLDDFALQGLKKTLGGVSEEVVLFRMKSLRSVRRLKHAYKYLGTKFRRAIMKQREEG